MGVDFLDIMFRLEKSLGIHFERGDFNFIPGGTYSVGEFYDLVERKVCKASSLKADGSPYTRAEIEDIVKGAICKALAVKPEEVTPEADLARDLGME